MKRRKFLKATLPLGGFATASTGLTACLIDVDHLDDSTATTVIETGNQLASGEGNMAMKFVN